MQAKDLVIGGIKYKTIHCSSQLDACHHLSDDCHHDEDELEEAVEGYHHHPVFGSIRSAPPWDLWERLILSLPYLFAGSGLLCFLLKTLRTIAL